MEYKTFPELREMWQDRRVKILARFKFGTPIIDIMQEFKISYPRVYQIINEEKRKEYATIQ